MQEAIEKAGVLIEALKYVQAYCEKIVVIKFGGSVMDNAEAMRSILADVVFMNAVGMRPVIVHGGGKAINRAMEKSGLEVQFVQGRRYTDQRTLTVVEHVLCNEVNRGIVETIQSFGCEAMGLHTLSSCVLSAERLYLSEDGRKIDLGMVGRLVGVNARLLELLCEADVIPVLAPLARDTSGGKLNCNADTAAGEVAAALRAEKFVVISDTHGIRRDLNDPESYFPTINETEIRERIAEGVISAGMLPKVEACLRALGAGVHKAHIVDGRILHSLLLEIFSDKGVGTLILKNDPPAE
jgi:acetylglutamate kinase